MICQCNGTVHIVCKPKWRVNTARDPFAAAHRKAVGEITLGKAVAQGLVVRSYNPRWDKRSGNLPSGVCPQCGQRGALGRRYIWGLEEWAPWDDTECVTCFVKRLRETPIEASVEVAS